MIFLGGSSTYDIYAPEGEDWPSLVERNLRALGYENVEVINAAVPGHATWDSLGRLYSEIWMFEPDYILIYNAWNDLGYFDWVNPDMGLLRGYRPWPGTKSDGTTQLVTNPHFYYTGPIDRLLCSSQVYVRLRWFYWKWRMRKMNQEILMARGETRQVDANPQTYRADYSPWGPRQYKLNLALIADTARNIGATPVLLTQARLVAANNPEEDRKRIHYEQVWLTHDGLVRALDDCDQAVLEVAQEKGLKVLDLSAMFSGRAELFEDEVHTTPWGVEQSQTRLRTFSPESSSKDNGGTL